MSFEQTGVIWGGDYRFLKITGEAKKHYEVGWGPVFAAGLKLGFGDAIGAKDRFPIFEPATRVEKSACAVSALADLAFPLKGKAPLLIFIRVAAVSWQSPR